MGEKLVLRVDKLRLVRRLGKMNPRTQKEVLAILCPTTNQIKGYPFEVVIPDGLPVSGAVLADQVKNLDWQARQAELICALPEATVAEVLAKLSTLLGE